MLDLVALQAVPEAESVLRYLRSIILERGDYNGRVLLHRAHAKDEARITQGAIVENKKLGAALGWTAERQRKRDAEDLAKPSISLRKKTRIRAAADLTA